MSLPNPNPFETAKADFKAETKLDADSNLALYLQYLNYRISRDCAAQSSGVADEMAVIKIELRKLMGNLSGIQRALEKSAR